MAHWPNLAAIDFATFEVPTENGKTQRNHALYAIKPSTREVRLIGVTDHADGQWMLNMARGMTDPDTGFLHGTTAVLLDRDPLFTTQVKDCIISVGSKPKILPPHSPNLNAYIERFIGTVRREIAQHIIPLSSDHLHHLLREHIAYYNRERNHQSLPGHGIPIPPSDQDRSKGGAIICRSRLGKTLNYYHRLAV